MRLVHLLTNINISFNKQVCLHRNYFRNAGRHLEYKRKSTFKRRDIDGHSCPKGLQCSSFPKLLVSIICLHTKTCKYMWPRFKNTRFPLGNGWLIRETGGGDGTNKERKQQCRWRYLYIEVCRLRTAVLKSVNCSVNSLFTKTKEQDHIYIYNLRLTWNMSRVLGVVWVQIMSHVAEVGRVLPTVFYYCETESIVTADGDICSLSLTCAAADY